MPRRKYAWEKLSDEQLLKRRLSSLRVTVEGTWLEDCLNTLYEELEERGIRLRPHAWISSEWFSPARRARHRHSLLSRPSPPDEARAEDDARRRGRHLVRVHGHSPSRGGPRRAARLPAAAPPALAAAVRPVLETLSALLPAQSGQPPLCPASSALVCAEPSGRGFRRNLRGVAAAALELADALCRLAGAEEARICRRADGRNRRQTAADHDAGASRSAACARARRLASTTRRSRRSTPSRRRRPTTATCTRLFSADPRHRRGRPASSFIRRHRARIRQLVARWTGENQLTLDAVLDDMISRCRELDLRVVGSERKLVTDFTVLLTAKTMHALFGPSRRKWIAL